MLRGLDERLEYIRTKLHVQIDPERTCVGDGWVGAYQLGMSDFSRGLCEPPPFFETARDLRIAWIEGYDFAADLAEMHPCEGCRAGDICRTHG